MQNAVANLDASRTQQGDSSERYSAMQHDRRFFTVVHCSQIGQAKSLTCHRRVWA